MTRFLSVLLAIMMFSSWTWVYAQDESSGQDRPSLKGYEDDILEEDVEEDELLDG